jgi:hypothetical protein
MSDKKDVGTENFSDALYKNVKMGADSIINVLSKVPEGELRNELTREINEYESFAKTLENMIYDMGDTPKEENILTKMGAKIGMAMNTMNDASPQHIAQMVIEGATMGVTEIIRLIRENENSNCSEKVMKLAKDIVAFEEDTIEKMKKFL